MKRTQLIAGIVCLVLAVVVYLLGGDTLAVFSGRTNVTVYPAAFLALLGLTLVLRWWKR